jgi:nitrogen-specific signal transduction histidine kinase
MLNRQLESSQPLSAELAGYIVGEVNKLNNFVSRFLDFARPLQLELAPHSLADIVDRAIKDVAATWAGPEVTVVRVYEDHLPAVSVDEDLCERAFTNLVQNAYDAMGEVGGGTLRVSLSAANRAGRRGVEARVEDTGPGVPSELREQIFNPMMTTKKSGVGLGLAIVSKIVDEHRGSIELCHTSIGACFIVFLPVASSSGAIAPASGAA